MWFQYCTIRLKYRHPSLESLACHMPNSENWGAAVGEQTMQTMWGSKLLQASQARPVSPLSIYDFTLALLETFRLYSLMDVAMPRRVRLFLCSNLVTFQHFQDISTQCARAKMIQHVYIYNIIYIYIYIYIIPILPIDKQQREGYFMMFQDVSCLVNFVRPWNR